MQFRQLFNRQPLGERYQPLTIRLGHKLSFLLDVCGRSPFPIPPFYPLEDLVNYSMMTQSLLLRPKTSGEYISSDLAGGVMKVPRVVARVL